MDTWFEYSDLFVNRRYQVQWGCLWQFVVFIFLFVPAIHTARTGTVLKFIYFLKDGSSRASNS